MEQLWHRLDSESGRAYEAFKVYMYLPPAERSIAGAWRLWSENPDAKREPPFFLRWSKSYAWSERARAHDHHLEILRESGREEAIKEEAARQARTVEQTRARFGELMTMAYEQAMAYLESGDFVRNLRPADVIRILQLHLETTHKLGGSETDALRGAPAVDWTEDEQRELDRLLDEIDAQEEKREKPEEGSSEDLGGDYSEEDTEENG